MGGVIVAWIIGTVIFLYLLYNTIIGAINNSKLTSHAQEIGELLQASAGRSRSGEGERELEGEEACPGCGARNPIQAKFCMACGLKLSE